MPVASRLQTLVFLSVTSPARSDPQDTCVPQSLTIPLQGLSFLHSVSISCRPVSLPGWWLLWFLILSCLRPLVPTLSSCLLRQDFIHSRLASYLVWSWERPWTPVSPASASQELGLLVCFGGTGVEPRPSSQALYPLEPQPQPVLPPLRKAVFSSLPENLWLTLSIFFTHSSVCSLAQLILQPAKCKLEWRPHDATGTWHVLCTACSSVL